MNLGQGRGSGEVERACGTVEKELWEHLLVQRGEEGTFREKDLQLQLSGLD